MVLWDTNSGSDRYKKILFGRLHIYSTLQNKRKGRYHKTKKWQNENHYLQHNKQQSIIKRSERIIIRLSTNSHFTSRKYK